MPRPDEHPHEPARSALSWKRQIRSLGSRSANHYVDLTEAGWEGEMWKAPVDQLAGTARRITAERLPERLSVANEHDEIGQLATIINDRFASRVILIYRREAL